MSTSAHLMRSYIMRLFFLVGLLLAPLTQHVPLPLRAAAPAAVLMAGHLAQPPEAHARRFGGGRSFGFRGGRSFGGFSRSRSYSRRSSFGRGYSRRGLGTGFGMGLGMGMLGGWGYGIFGLGRMFLFPIVMLFILRMMSRR